MLFSGSPVPGIGGLDHLEGETVTIFGFEDYSAGGALDPYVCEEVTFDPAKLKPNDPAYKSGFQPNSWCIDHVKQQTYAGYSLDTGVLELVTMSMTTKSEVRRITLPFNESEFFFYDSRAVELAGVDWIMARGYDVATDAENATIINTVTGARVELANLPVGAQAVGGVNSTEPMFAMPWVGNPDYFLSFWRVEQDFEGATPEMEKTAIAIASHHRTTGVSKWIMYADDGPAKSFIGSFGDTFLYFTYPYQVTATETSVFIAFERRADVWPANEPTDWEIWQLNVDAAENITFSMVSSFRDQVSVEATDPDTFFWTRLKGGAYDALTDKFVVSWWTQIPAASHFAYFTRIDRATGLAETTIRRTPTLVFSTYYSYHIAWNNIDPSANNNRNDLLPGYVMLNALGTGGPRRDWILLDIATMTQTIFAKDSDPATDPLTDTPGPAAVLSATECAIWDEWAGCAFPEDTKIVLCAPASSGPMLICTDIVINGEVQFCGLLSYAIVGLPTEACIRLLPFAEPTIDGSTFSRDVRVDGILMSVLNTRFITAQSGHSDLIPEPLLEKTLADLSMDEINSWLLAQNQAGLTDELRLLASAYGIELPDADYVPMFSGNLRAALDDTWDGSNGEIEICSNGPHPCLIRSVTRMTDHEPGQSRKKGG
jgi:hypothetical protein